jgi:hypothetical protein
MTKDRTHEDHQAQAIEASQEEHLEKGPHESALVTRLTELIEQLDIAEKRRAKAEIEADDALNLMVGYETDIKELKDKIAYIEGQKHSLEKTLESNDVAATEKIIEDLQKVQKELARIKALEGNEKQQITRLVLQNEKYKNEIGELKEATKESEDKIIQATEERCKKGYYKLIADIQSSICLKLVKDARYLGIENESVTTLMESISSAIDEKVPDRHLFSEISHNHLEKEAKRRRKRTTRYEAHETGPAIDIEALQNSKSFITRFRVKVTNWRKRVKEGLYLDSSEELEEQ